MENNVEHYYFYLCNVNGFGNVYSNYTFVLRNDNNYSSYITKSNY